MERLPGSFPLGGRFVVDEGLLPPLEPDDPHAPSSTAPPSPAAPMRNDLRSIEATISPHLSSSGMDDPTDNLPASPVARPHAAATETPLSRLACGVCRGGSVRLRRVGPRRRAARATPRPAGGGRLLPAEHGAAPDRP